MLSKIWIAAAVAAVLALVLAFRPKKVEKREVLTAAARRWFTQYTAAKVGRGDMSPLSAGQLYSLYFEEHSVSPFEDDPELEQLNAFLARQPY